MESLTNDFVTFLNETIHISHVFVTLVFIGLTFSIPIFDKQFIITLYIGLPDDMSVLLSNVAIFKNIIPLLGCAFT